MQVSIKVEAERGEGKTHLIEKLLKVLKDDPSYQVNAISKETREHESVIVAVEVNKTIPQTTNKDHVLTLISASAKHSTDNEGSASMHFSQAAVNATNAMMNLAALKGQEP